MKEFIKNCLSYKGRWNRQKFWLYPLGFMLIILIPIIIVFILSTLGQFGLGVANAIDIQPTGIESIDTTDYQANSNMLSYMSGLIFMLLIMVMYVLLIYVSFVSYIKRLHDLNKSGWMSLLLFVPLANIYLFIICGFFKGTHGENKFGLDPLGGIMPNPDSTTSKEL